MPFIKLQQLILTLRTYCALEPLCGILRINIELVPLRNDGHNRVEHYGNAHEEIYFGRNTTITLLMILLM